MAEYVVYIRAFETWSSFLMPSVSTIPKRPRSFSLSIGQLTFGSFMLVLAMTIMTSIGSVVAIHHIDATFAELQRLQGVGDLAEEIDRRMNELRLAARDFVTDPGARPDRASEVASSLGDLLNKARLKLASGQQVLIDGVTARLAAYREGVERVSTLISRRSDLAAALPPLRERLEATIAEAPDRMTARNLFRAQNQIASALLAHDTSAVTAAAQRMRLITIDDAPLRAAVDAYADGVMAISNTEAEIAGLDKEVLGEEGRLIGRVTELLREISMRQGQIVASEFADTLTEARQQSILLGIAG